MNLPRRIYRGICRARGAVDGGFSPLRFRKLLYPAAGAVVASMAVGFFAYLEYRTNCIAEWVGEALDRNNARRATSGAFWKRLDTWAQVRDSLQTVETPVVGVLPDALADARFDADRVPESGMPTLITVWRSQRSRDNGRETRELLKSVEAFNLGLSLLKLAVFPDVRFRDRIRSRVDALYRHAGDTERRGEADTVVVADSVRADVRERLERVFVEQFRSDERNRLMKEFRSGRVSQILIQSGLGTYHGELVYVDPERAPVRFDVEPGEMDVLFGGSGGLP
ncbi:MAG: hypothetical protein J4F39_04420 [Candidatus Latescibacteria bacterium]|nr:hypothetical protein [Candidatus Latescibacterota bacterium]